MYKHIFIGIIIGMVLGSTLAYAAMTRVFLIDGNENPVGTTTNPLYINLQ